MQAESSKEGKVTRAVLVTFSADGKAQSILQHFHIKYFTSRTGELKIEVLAVTQKIHKELFFIADALGINYGRGRDPNLEMLCTCREMQKTRVVKLKNVLISMSDGTFSFVCSKGECPQFSKCPHKRDLTEMRRVEPTALACVWFRQQREGTSIPQGKRQAFF